MILFGNLTLPTSNVIQHGFFFSSLPIRVSRCSRARAGGRAGSIVFVYFFVCSATVCVVRLVNQLDFKFFISYRKRFIDGFNQVKQCIESLIRCILINRILWMQMHIAHPLLCWALCNLSSRAHSSCEMKYNVITHCGCARFIYLFISLPPNYLLLIRNMFLKLPMNCWF